MSLPTPKYRRGLLADEDFLNGTITEHPYNRLSGVRHIMKDVEHTRLNFGPYFEEYGVDDLREVDAAVQAVSLGHDYDVEAVGEAFSRLYDALSAREGNIL